MNQLFHVITEKWIGNKRKKTWKQPRWMVTAVEFDCPKGYIIFVYLLYRVQYTSLMYYYFKKMFLIIK
jgi:hypothetical protein